MPSKRCGSSTAKDISAAIIPPPSGYLNYWITGDNMQKCIDFFSEANLIADDTHIFNAYMAQIVRLSSIEDVIQHLESLDLGNKRHFLLPVNNSGQGYEIQKNGQQFVADNGGHWSLLYLDKEARCFSYLDSSNLLNFQDANKLADQLKNFFSMPAPVQFNIFPALQQVNGNDCGLYTLSYMHNFLANKKFDNSNFYVSLNFVLSNLLANQPGKRITHCQDCGFQIQ